MPGFLLSILILFMMMSSGCNNPSGGSVIRRGNAPFLKAPAAFSFTQIRARNGNIDITWQQSKRAAKYDFYMGTSSSNITQHVSECSGGLEESCELTGLDPNTVYYFDVKATNDVGSRKISSISSALSVGLFNITSSSPSDGTITLSWDPADNATGYNIIFGTRTGFYTQSRSNVTSPYTITGLTNGVRYYVKVVGINSQNGYSPSTNEINQQPFGPLPAPSGLALSATPGQINLNWNDTSGATYYKVYRGLTASSLTEIATNVVTSNYTDTPVSDGTPYFYSVVAYNGFDSPQSSVTSAQSISSFNMTSAVAGPAPAQVTLTWPTPTGATAFDVRYGTNPASLTGLRANVTSPYTVTGLTGGLTYYFRVVAKNTVGADTTLLSSNQLSQVPVPPLPAPANLTATATPGTIQLNWNAVSGASSYKVLRGTTSGSLTEIASGLATTTYTDTPVTNGTTYFYAVKAFNGYDSASSAEVQKRPISDFSFTSATVASFRSVDVSWNAATGASGYDILYGTTPGVYSGSYLNRTSPTTLSGLSGSTTYYIAIRAKNSVGGSTTVISNERSITTTATYPTVSITTYPLINNANKASYTVSGACSENSRNVTVTIGSVSTNVTCTSLAWSATLNVTAVPDSPTRSISAVHTNSGGNSDTATRSVVKDTANPTVAITSYPAINNTNKDSYTFSGTCSENTRNVSLDIGGITSNQTCTSLTWSATLDVSSLSDSGSITITADTNDAAGNTATQATRTIVKDTAIPAVAITSSPVINNANKAAYVFSGTCSESGRNVSVKVGATTGTVLCTASAWTATLNVITNADSGNLLITADHSDASNNAAVQATANVIKDTVNPTVAITSSPLINNANKASYTISGTCSEEGNNVSVNVGGITDTPACTSSAWTTTLDVTGISDSSSVAVSATQLDDAGNTRTASTTVVKNTNLPTVAISSSPIINNANKASYTVSGSCTENSRPVSVNVGGVTANPTCTSLAWTATLNVSSVSDNANIAITADHSDTVGNSANQASTSVLKDTVNPTVAITSSPVMNNANKASYTLSGTCTEEGRNVSIMVGTISSTPTCNSSAWSTTINASSLSDSTTLAISANHSDAAGNNATPATTTIVKDTANPTVAINAPSVINSANQSAYTVSGTCSENTRTVSVDVGGVTSTPTCSALAWSTTLDVSGISDSGSVSITANHSDAAGNSATQASRTTTKDTSSPTVAITSSTVINNSNKSAYTVNGTCSDTGSIVSVSVGTVDTTDTCTLLTWSVTVDVSGNPDSGSLLITADHTDVAGNPAVQAGITVVKDTANPTVAITSSPAINNANKASYTISGTCSENTRAVTVNVGGVTDSPVCSSSAWSSTLNVTGVADNSSVAVSAGHADSAGNSATASTTVIKNTALPTVAITSSPVINNANKTSYTVSGTCSENTRAVSVNVGSLSATPTCNTGAWTTTLNVSTLSDSGSVAITADHDDSVGNNANQASTTVVKDTINPTVALTSTPVINDSNKSSYPVSGTCSEDTRNVSVAVGSATATPVCSSGTWSASLNVTAVADNASISISANHTDAAGNSATPASTTALKDTGVPTVSITVYPVINNTNKASYTVSGACSENTRTVSVNVGGVTATPACTTLAWSATLDVTSVSDSGSVTITANHSDAAGNNATQASRTVVKDTALPTVAITSSPIINNANKAAYTVSGTCSENTQTVSVNVGGITATPTCSSSAWTSTLNVTTVADNASVSISANHSDASGNAATQASTTVLKDVVIPTVAISSAPAINSSNSTAYPISGTCSENSRTVTVNVGGVTSSPTCSSNSWSASMNVSGVTDSGSVAVTANQSDAAGNPATQASTNVVKNTGLPTVSIASAPAINNTNKAAYTLSGNCSENTRSVSVSVGGISATPTCSSLAWSAILDVSSLSDGSSIAISADHTDSVGNNAVQATDTVVKDIVLPTVAITSSPVINNSNKTSYTVSGSCSENTRTVTVNVGGVAATPTCTTLAWSATVNVTAVSDNASISITANHTDAAGNAATQALTTVVKDTAIPTVAITFSPAINNTNKSSYTVSGTCSENTQNVSVNVGGVSGTPVCSSLAWSTTLDVSSISDSASVSVTANHSDASGNAANQASTTVIKDTGLPTIAITSSPVINNANEASYTVSGTCSENTLSVNVNVGGITASPACSSSAWSATLNVTTVSDNSSVAITANHSDSVGNAATQASASVVKDTVDPTVAISSTPAINNSNKASYTVTGTCSENSQSVTVNVGGVTATPTCTTLAWSATLNVSGISDGTTISVTANHSDSAGNASSEASASTSKDTVDPTVAISSSPSINNTNKSSYPISGSCSENTRTVSVNVGGVTATPTCTALSWSTSLDVSSLTDNASISITVDHSDTNGNPATQAATSVIKDTLLPTVAITSSPIINNSNKSAYPVSGTCSEDTRIVTVSVGGISATPTCTTGAWSASLNVNTVSDGGAVSVTANHTDLAGNSATQASTTVVKDTANPTVAITSYPVIHNANKASYTVSGTCSENTQTVSVSVGGVSATPTCSATAWSATVDVSSLSDNSAISITANHSDASGNSATQASRSVVKDTVDPTVAITSSPAINNTNKSAYPVSGTCSENTQTVSVNVGGVTANPVCSSGNWSSSLNVSGIADNSSVSITANHSDASGNPAPQASTTVLKDIVIPTVAISSAPLINNANKASYPVSGSCSENTRTVTVNVGGVSATPTCTSLAWSASLNVSSVGDGASVSVTANHTDLAGNSASTASTTVVKDTLDPTVAITSTPVINNGNKASYTVSGSCSENTRAVTVSVGGVTGTPTCSSSAWSIALDVSGVTDSGSVTVTANHSDASGNPAPQASTTVVKDTVAPTVAITSAPDIYNSNKGAYTVSGTCSENTRNVIVSIGGSLFSATCTSLAWSTGAVNVSGVSDSANLSITANHADAAGNSATQASDTVVKDTSNPSVAITSSPVINNSNKTSYTVSGTCSDTGENVVINVGSVSTSDTCTLLTWSATVDVSGNPDSTTLLITADHTDAVGNSAVQAGITVVKDTAIPTVTIASAPTINNSNRASYTVSGTCSENTRTVSVSVGGISTSPVCTSLSWTTAALDVTSLSDSTSITVTANHSDSAGNSADEATATITKDTSNPTVAITSAPDINIANRTAYTVSGTCSENTRTVDVEIGTLSFTPTCSSSSWSTGAVDVSTLSDNTAVTITADQSDANGNAATQDTDSIIKDTIKPGISLSTTEPATTSTSPFIVRATFTEATSGIALSDFAVTNATASNLNVVSSTVYEISVSPVAEGTVTINFAADLAIDVVGNNNTAATQLSRYYVPPAVLTFTASTTYDFGSVNIGDSADVTFLINKSGTPSATSVTEISLSAPFAFKGGSFPGTGGTCTTTISGTCSVVVRYTPTTAAVHNDSIQLQYNNGAATVSVSRSLTGTGVSVAPTHSKIEGPAGIQINQCVPYTIYSTTSSGEPARVSANQTVNLVINNSSGTTTRFYSNSTCGTSATSTIISSGTSSKVVYLRSTTAAQSITLVANPTSLLPSTLDVNTTNAPNRIDVTLTAEMETAKCLPITVNLIDSTGARVGKNTAVQVNLAENGAAVFYSDVNCTGPITSVSFPAYTETKTIYIVDNTEQTVNLTFSDNAGALTSDSGSVTFVDALTWWNTAYAKRVPVIISNQDQATAHTNMPVLIKLDTSKIDYADIQSNGEDIRFTLDNHTTTLNYEIESWNSSGESLVWVNIPSLSASSTRIIYMYYNNPSASDGQNASSAWTGFSGVWNMKKSGSNYVDSTGSGKTGVPEGTVADISGPVGNAIYVNGSSDIDVGYDLSQIIGRSSTFSFWMKTTQTGSNTAYLAPGITGVEEAGGGNDIFFGWISGSGTIRVSSGNGNFATSDFIVNDNSWRFITMTRNESNGDVSFYVNGVLNGTGRSESGAKTTPFSKFGVIADTGGGPMFFNGSMDGIRLTNSIQTDARIKAEYKFSTGNNVSFGSPEDL